MNSQADYERFEREAAERRLRRSFRITPDLMSGAATITLGKPMTPAERHQAINMQQYTRTPEEKERYMRDMMGVPCRSGYGITPLTGRHFDALKWWREGKFDTTMAVDPAVKNKKKKENKMDNYADSPVTAPAEPQQGFIRRYDVMIGQVENGFIIKVGCKTFVSMDWKEASKALGEYFKDPIAAEKKFCKRS